MNSENRRESSLIQPEPRVKMVLLPFRIKAWDYVNFVLIQDIFVSIINIIITMLELDSKESGKLKIYLTLALPVFQISATLYVWLFKMDFVKSSVIESRIMRFVIIRL